MNNIFYITVVLVPLVSIILVLLAETQKSQKLFVTALTQFWLQKKFFRQRLQITSDSINYILSTIPINYNKPTVINKLIKSFIKI